MKKILSSLTVISIGMALSAGSIAAPSNPFAAEAGSGNFKKINGFQMDRCFLDSDTSIDFCDPAQAKIMAKMVDRKPTFSKNSVLMRFWDDEMNIWTYVAFNQKTKKLFFYPRGIRSITEPYKNVKVTYGKNKDRICTTGANTSMVGDIETKAYDDSETDVDYCNNYSETTGFGSMNRVDSKTRKIVAEKEFKL